MFNILAAPGEVFAEIKDRPVEHSNWLVPAVLWALIGVTLSMLLLSQPWAIAEITRIQVKAIEQQVAIGKMPQAQGDQAIEALHKYMPVALKFIGGVMTTIYAFGVPFFWGIIIMILANHVFKTDIDAMKGVEAAGLASVVYLLGTILATLASFAMGRLVPISPAFFLKDFDITNRAHLAIAAFNPFYLWFLSVIAVSVSVLGNVPMRKALPICAVIWLGMRGLFLSNQVTAGWVM